MTDRPPHTRCHGCGRRWAGLAECHCAGCHQHFSSVSAFDLHRVSGECIDPAGHSRLVVRSGPHGVVWGQPSSDRQDGLFPLATAAEA